MIDVDEQMQQQLEQDPDVAAFKECFSRPGAYTEFIMTLPFRQTAEQREFDDSNAFGTRAKGTERLVSRILQSPEYRTLEIVTRFLEAALPTADRKTLPARAQNILDRMEKYGESGVPKNELDLGVMVGFASDRYRRQRRTPPKDTSLPPVQTVWCPIPSQAR